MIDSNSLVQLIHKLTPIQMLSVAESLEMGQPISIAASNLPNEMQAEIKMLLAELMEIMSTQGLIISLKSFAETLTQTKNYVDLVWSGKQPGNAVGQHTFAVLQDVISEAKEYIYAATFSATENSPALIALDRASRRGVAVTILVDPVHLASGYFAAKQGVTNARVLKLAEANNDLPANQVPYMHAKFIMVDSKTTFITSANFSITAAHNSFELGLKLDVPFIAQQVKDRIDAMLQFGMLVDC